MTEIGAVNFNDFSQTFHGKLRPITDRFDPAAAAVTGGRERTLAFDEPLDVMERFDDWLREQSPSGRPVFVSDNPGFDFMWVATYFHTYLGRNPFGWSSRRIGDIWAGACGDLRRPWKHLREAPHDHNPVNDALGNAQALKKILEMMK